MSDLEAVLPLTARDLSRAMILCQSLAKHFSSLERCWVLVPDDEVVGIRAELDRPGFTVLAETEVVPELRNLTAVAGWYRQQLLKLAMADVVASPFYLTLDADVVCIRRVTPADLILDGKALVNTPEVGWVPPEWYEQAAHVLHLPRSRHQHGVTPCIYSVEAMRQLHRFLSMRLPWVSRTRAALTAGARRRRRNWVGYLAASQPWAEMQLYHTFVEAHELFSRYHVRGGNNSIYAGAGSLWQSSRVLDWSPEEALSAGADCYFVVVQSNTGISPERVLETVRTLIS